MSEIRGAPPLHGASKLAKDIVTCGDVDKFVICEPHLWVDTPEAAALTNQARASMFTPPGYERACVDAFKVGGYLVFAALQNTVLENEYRSENRQDVNLWKDAKKDLRSQLEADPGIESQPPYFEFWQLSKQAIKRHVEFDSIIDRLDGYFTFKHRGTVGLFAELGAGFVLHSLDVCWDRICDEITTDRHLNIRTDDTPQE